MTYDYSALARPKTEQDTTAYRERFAKKKNFTSNILMGILILVVLFIFFGPVFTDAASNSQLHIVTPIFGTIAVVVAAGFIGAGIAHKRRLTRLLAFANDNKAKLAVDVFSPTMPGVIFSQGHSQTLKEAIRFPNGHEIGNYSYVTGSGKSRVTHNWSYMRVHLVRKLPHMLLDARKNNIFGGKYTNLPTTLTGDQKMRLEGNFNDYFTLYAPKGYERDALYVFTPDVMVALIDFGANHDIEVIDDSLLFYRQGNIKLTNASKVAESLGVLDKVSSEIIDQGEYYADDRIGNRSIDAIAAPGQRLKTRMSIITAIILILLFIYFLWIFYRLSQP